MPPRRTFDAFRLRPTLACLALLAALLPAPPALRGDVKTPPAEKKSRKDKPEERIPEARPSSAGFTAGVPVDVEISASVGTLKQVEFLIRQQPEHGTLSAPRPHPRETNRGIVTYTHRGGDAPLADRFVFACRVDGGPVSAPATVTLVGKRFEPRLEIVDFFGVDKVFLGGEATVRFAVKNTGAAPFASDYAWEPPWEGPSRIELKPGETARHVVQFRPDRAGIFRIEKILQPGVQESSLSLYGQCVRPLTITPGRLVLLAGPNGTREGELILNNGRTDPVRVEVRPPQRLQGGGTIEVPGVGKARVALALPAHDVDPFHGEIRIVTPQGPETILVEAAAKPAELRVISPPGDTLDLGEVRQGREGRGEIEIRNTGGTPAVIQAQAKSPVVVHPAGEAVRLPPGGQAKFTVTVRAEEPGPVQAELAFSGDASAPRFRVRMNVVTTEAIPRSGDVRNPTAGAAVPNAPTAPSTIPATQEPDPARRSQIQSQLLAYLSAHGLPVPQARINPSLPRITEVFLTERTPHRIGLSWKKPAAPPAGWIIEAASMAKVSAQGQLVKVWSPLKNWKIQDGPADSVAVRIEPLPAAAQLELRIMGVDRDEKVSEPSPSFIVNTAAPWRVPTWAWISVLITALGAALFALDKLRRGEWEWHWPRARKPKPKAGTA